MEQRAPCGTRNGERNLEGFADIGRHIDGETVFADNLELFRITVYSSDIQLYLKSVERRCGVQFEI